MRCNIEKKITELIKLNQSTASITGFNYETDKSFRRNEFYRQLLLIGETEEIIREFAKKRMQLKFLQQSEITTAIA